MFSFLGWLNVVLLGILVLPWILVRLNKYVLKTKSKAYLNFIRFLRSFHKPLGILMVIVALVHGYMAFGFNLRLHTGPVLALTAIIAMVTGGMYYKLKKKNVFLVHKIFSALAVVMLLIHLFFPRAFS